MDSDLMRRPAPERAREFRTMAKTARDEAAMASGLIQKSFTKIAMEWEYLAQAAEAEAKGTA